MEILDKIGLAYLWSAIKLQMSNYQSLAPGVAIPSGADLDDYVEPGTYYVVSATVAASLTHSPTTGAGYMLTVVKTYGAASTGLWRTQIAMTAAGISYLRYRNGSAGAWSSWQKLLFTDTTYDAATAEAAGLMSAEDKAKLDGFEAASKYALQSSIDAIEVGGRNLILNSSFSADFEHWTLTGSPEITTVDGVTCAHIVGAFGVVRSVQQRIISKINVDDLSQTYVFSADVRVDNYVAGDTNPYVKLYFSGAYNNNDGASKWLGATTVSGTPEIKQYSDQGWVRMMWVVRFAQKPTSMGIYIFARDFTGDLYFKNLQLELGTVATDWTPAPEDKADAPVFVSAALSVAGWTDNTDEETKERYPKVYALAVSGATAAHGAECCIAPASMEEAVVRGVCPSASVTDGYVNFYAQETPAAAITVQYRLI